MGVVKLKNMSLCVNDKSVFLFFYFFYFYYETGKESIHFGSLVEYIALKINYPKVIIGFSAFNCLNLYNQIQFHSK